MISIDDVLPSKQAARDGYYCLARLLLFLAGPLTQPLAQTFIDYALGDDGQQIVEHSGWVPVK
jgi:ABC-type phosphate transport system substrate-binding protein